MSDADRVKRPADRTESQTSPETEKVEISLDSDAQTAELKELRRQLDEKQDRLLRALAEMDNMRRRTQREREESVRYANEGLVRELIPVLDNLDRALAAARSGPDVSRVVEGVELIQRELLRVLERAGVTRHEATGRVVKSDQPPGTVVSEQVPGYVLNGRVLRPAQVAVAAAPDEDAA